MLINCNNKNYALNLIRQNINLFEPFNNVFLFGSVLHSKKNHHDIDILLIYSVYSEQLLEIVNYIYNTLNNASKLPVDLTDGIKESLIGATSNKELISRGNKICLFFSSSNRLCSNSSI